MGCNQSHHKETPVFPTKVYLQQALCPTKCLFFCFLGLHNCNLSSTEQEKLLS